MPILPDFKPKDIHHIVNHSDTTIIFVADNIFETINGDQMKALKCMFSLADFSNLYVQDSIQPTQISEELTLRYPLSCYHTQSV